MAFLTSIHGYSVARKPIDPCKQNKERTYHAYGLLYTRRKIARADLTQFVKDCVSRNGRRINTTEPNQMILVSFFSEDNVLSEEIKIIIVSNVKVTKIERSAFWGQPRRYTH